MMNEDDVNQNASKGEADSGAGASSTALRKIEGGAGKQRWRCKNRSRQER